MKTPRRKPEMRPFHEDRPVTAQEWRAFVVTTVSLVVALVGLWLIGATL